MVRARISLHFDDKDICFDAFKVISAPQYVQKAALSFNSQIAIVLWMNTGSAKIRGRACPSSSTALKSSWKEGASLRANFASPNRFTSPRSKCSLSMWCLDKPSANLVELMTSPALLVLAAGMGNRYRGLKQIDPVGPGGETIIDYSIYDALRAGFRKLVFVIRKDLEHPFKEAVGTRVERHTPVEYAFQELGMLPPEFSVPAGRTKPWGTTHAILTAASAITGPFAVINADDYYGPGGYRALAQHLQSGTVDYAMVGFVLRNTLSDFGAVSRGVCEISDRGFLQQVVELTNIEPEGARARNTDAAGRITQLTGDEVVSMNMWGFTPQIFGQIREHFHKFLELNISDAQSESHLPSVINELVHAGEARVRVLRTNDSWAGVTYREDHARVVETIGRRIDDGTYPKRLWP
jgi:dTDP-glucose pyrophosphorylase